MPYASLRLAGAGRVTESRAGGVGADGFAATVMRGDRAENRHCAHIAVTDAAGRLLYESGDARRLTWIRSTAKPAQALAVLEASDGDDFGFDAAELALLCASHSASLCIWSVRRACFVVPDCTKRICVAVATLR